MDEKSVAAADGKPPQEPRDAGPTGPYRPGYELVAEQILELITELRLEPGERMPTEKDSASRLGASRTVVREAVKILSAIGRVCAQKGRGALCDGRRELAGVLTPASRRAGFIPRRGGA
ncbi:FadR/GntR family transcriptional regulator [Streptomyces sp. DSM 41534]